ncbi:MAG: hypothetical protein RL291_946 [Pseudomonadota bacterium]
MVEFLIKAMKGFGYGLMIGPVVVAVIAYIQTVQHNRLVEDMREARATIRNANVLTPRAQSASVNARQYTLDLDWRDEQGQQRRADNILIHPRLGRRLVDGDELIQDTVRIRYSALKPDRVVMIEPQGAEVVRRDPFMEALYLSGYSWPLAMIGGILFYFALKREEKRSRREEQVG